jgi:hypothetical protein
MEKKVNLINISAIETYFGIKNTTALYIYYRFLRSKRTDEKYLPWSLQFQNALVYADKSLGIDWVNLKFEDELTTLEKNGIDVNDQGDVVFRWIEDYEVDSEWTQVSRKKLVNPKQIIKNLKMYV